MDKMITKVPNHYIGDNCVQEMIGYDNYLLFLSEDNTLYRDINGKKIINKYIDDERNKQFPYHNIPYHIGRYNKIFTNQILNLNKPYLQLSDTINMIHYATTCEGNTYILHDYYVPTKTEKQIITDKKTNIDDIYDYYNNLFEIAYKYDPKYIKELINSNKIFKISEPKISLKYNFNISPKDIREAKRMVKTLKR